MAEQEGFTFVDKRRVSSDAPPEAAEPSAEDTGHFLGAGDAAASGNDADNPDHQSEGTPTTYDLIGYCINLLAQQAWQKLGLLADPQTGEAQPDLAEAKVAIDTVGDLANRLEAAPETAVPSDLRRELRTLVNDLRLNYVSRRGQDSVAAA